MTKTLSSKSKLLFNPGFTVNTKAQRVHLMVSLSRAAIMEFPADAGFLCDKTAVLMATIVQTTKEGRLLTPITIFKAPSPDQKKKSILTRTKFVSKQLKHLKIQNILT